MGLKVLVVAGKLSPLLTIFLLNIPGTIYKTSSAPQKKQLIATRKIEITVFILTTVIASTL